MKKIIAVLLFAVAATPLAFGRNAAIENAVRLADAVAYARVVSVAEDLKDERVMRRATLSVIGKSHGLNGATLFEIPFGAPSKLGSHRFS